MIAGLQTSYSALHAQRMRMNVIASNMANAYTTRTPEGGAYKPQQIVFAAQGQAPSFAQLLQTQRLDDHVSEVRVVDIVPVPDDVRLEYDPKHPDANKEGYVAYPNINVMQEMVDLMSTTRSYEANVTAINAAKDMALRALQIGQG